MNRTIGSRDLIPLLAAVLIFAGCGKSPEQKYTRFLERGQERMQKKEYGSALIEFRSASQVQPKKAEPYYQLGRTYLALGDVRSGVGYLRKAIELDQNHKEAQLKLAELMASTNSQTILEEAEKRTEALLTQTPDNAEALRVMALAELKLGKPENAEAHLQQALAKLPENLSASIMLARMKIAEKKFDEAESILKKAADASPKSPEAWVVLGDYYLMHGKTAEAEAAFRKALQTDPRDPAGLLGLTLIQVRAKRLDQAEATVKQLASVPDPKFRSVHAIFLFETGRRDAAIQEFESLLRRYPDDRTNRTRLVMAYVLTKRLPAADKLLAEALKRNPKDLEALEVRSRLSLSAGDLDKAQADANQMIHFRPDWAEAHYLKAAVHRQKREDKSYEQELGEALRLNPQFWEARLDLSALMRASKHAKNALDLLNSAPEEQKQILPVIVERNWINLVLGKDGDVRQGIQEGLKLGRHPDLFLQDALLKMRGKDFAGARLVLAGILKQNPENFRALQTLMTTYVETNQPAEAIAKLKEYAALRVKSHSMQFFLGQWLAVSGDRKGAREAFQRSRTLNPSSVPATLALAQFDIAEGNLDAARKALASLLAADARNTAARYTLGTLEGKAGNPSAAADNYRAVVNADPSNVMALNNLAYVLAEFLKSPDEALPYAQKAVEVSPASPTINDTLGWIYYQKGMYRRAVQHLDTAVSGQPVARHKYHLAMACEKNGNHNRAVNLLREAIIMDPNLPEAATASIVVAASR
jgi:tetratricopeptide (TPR) repeat protein